MRLTRNHLQRHLDLVGPGTSGQPYGVIQQELARWISRGGSPACSRR
ncbi:hypothetical protein [Nonomuraea phyllanthi]|nr:hypothetical protein [Nonomuraea phyllanthi]